MALIELGICWIAWTLAFVKPSRQASGQKEATQAPSSKWGIFLVMVGYALAWAYVRPDPFFKSTPAVVLSMLVCPPAVLLVWAATRHLGKQWRFKAALSEDHELVQTGPYRWLRHPIYTSMFAMLLGTGAVWAWWPLWIGSIVAFLAGTEIRVRAEERLLAERFNGAFQAYKARTWAFLPFLR